MVFWKHKFLCFSGACVCGSNIAYTSDKQIIEYFHHLLKNRRKLVSNDGLRHTIVHVRFLYHPVSLNVNPSLRDVLCRGGCFRFAVPRNLLCVGIISQSSTNRELAKRQRSGIRSPVGTLEGRQGRSGGAAEPLLTIKRI